MPSVPDLSRLIPLTARNVLDIGCGRGETGAAYRRLNPNARIWGFDLNPAAVAEARQHYDACVVADAVAAFPPFDTPPRGFDCILYSMILDELTDPIALLRRQAEALAADGTMVFRTSNPMHWRLAERLLRGERKLDNAERPSDMAISRQNPRLGPETIRRDLIDGGLVPFDVQPLIGDEPAGRAFIEAVSPALRNLGIDAAAYARTALSRSYVWRIGKTPLRRLVVAGDMLRPIGGVSHLRVIHPFQAMATDPAVTTHFASPADPPEIGENATPETPKIFILHRPALMGAQGQRVVDALIDKGWLVITEFDDHPDFLRGMNDPALVSFRGVHAVQTTTTALAEVLRQRNPEIALFPNAIESLPEIRNFTDPRVLTVFFGALNRETDWRPLMGAINTVARRAGPRLRFRVVHDEGFFQALETPDKSFTPLCDYETYLDLLGTSEISLMPLRDTPFNRAKSDLKFIEAGACRVATLASSVVYTDSVAHGETGLIFQDPEEFHRQFLRLAAVPDLALHLADNARRMVIETRMLADQVAPRIAWYRELWGRRDELTKALRSRVGGLPLPAE